MTVMLNTECNLKCQHCFARSFDRHAQNRKKLNPEEMKVALSEMVANGVFHFALQGGEPFLYRHLDEAIRACKPWMSYITLVTNGTCVGEDQLQHVYSLGVDKMAVSIDSYISEEHDTFRGAKGSHKKAMNTLEAAKSIGLDIGINVL